MRKPGVTKEKGVIAWFAANQVAANLLMILIIVGGLLTVGSIRKETNPKLELNMIQVRVPYLGAAPQEVEEGVVLKVEDAIQDLVGIKKIRSNAYEGAGQVTVEVFPDADIDQLLSDIKTRVDAISTFPGLTEKPIIYKQEMFMPVIMIALHGNLDDFGRKALGNEIRDELLGLSKVKVPVLGLYGSNDMSVKSAFVLPAFQQLSGPRYVIELVDQPHIYAAGSWQDQSNWVLLFLAAYLKDDETARKQLALGTSMQGGGVDRQKFELQRLDVKK